MYVKSDNFSRFNATLLSLLECLPFLTGNFDVFAGEKAKIPALQRNVELKFIIYLSFGIFLTFKS
jgi:hypothetical protein